MRTVAVLAVVAVLVVVTVRRRVVVVSVAGLSMAPTLAPGDRVLVRKVPVGRVRRGDVVVVRELAPCRRDGPAGPRWVVKRVAALPGDPAPSYLPSWARGDGVVAAGTLVLLGDNPAVSRDSRQVGGIPAERLLGVAVRRLGGPALPVRPG